MWFEQPRVITGRIETAHPEFTLDIRLRSAGHLSGRYEASDESPPMPAAFGSLGLYRLGYHYLVHDGQSGLSVELGDPAEDARITLIQSRQGPASRLTVYLNGDEAGHHDTASDILGVYTLGKGFLNRFWRGDLDYVDFLPRATNMGSWLRGRRILGSRDLMKAGEHSGFPG